MLKFKIKNMYKTQIKELTLPKIGIMKRLYMYIIVSLLLIGCRDNVSEQAYKVLDEARMAMQEHRYDDARRKIDSLRFNFPRAIDARRDALEFMDSLELSEAKTLYMTADSMQVFKKFELDDLKKSFVLEKQEKYQTTGYYVTPDYAGSKSSYDFFPEVEETGKLLLVTITRGNKINYDFTEVDLDSAENIPATPLTRTLSAKEQRAYEKCYALAKCFKEYQEAKALREKYDVKVRFFEKKMSLSKDGKSVD